MNITEYHKLDLDPTILQHLIANPGELGLNALDLAGKPPKQQHELLIGEYFARISQITGKIASEMLMNAQWGYQEPEWFDHRHHTLDPERFFKDHWTVSADNVLQVFPMGGSMLNLCSGDGYYDYHFFRSRAREIWCIDNNQEAHRQAVRLHRAANIQHVRTDVLAYQAPDSRFDVVLIRGAIEHFSEDHQQLIFQKAFNALKVGGWFCGDTPANPHKEGGTMLGAHENEWSDEAEMREQLERVFDHVETRTFVSEDRTTLLWRCQRTN